MTLSKVPPPRAMPGVVTLVMASVMVFVAQEVTGYAMFRVFALWPLNLTYPTASRFELWQLMTYGFMHGSLPHLVFNMLALWMFGCVLESIWGSARLVVYYLACVIAAGLTQVGFAALGFGGGVVVGGSGGVFGLLLAFALKFPREIIIPLIPPIPMRASVLAVLYGSAALLFGLFEKAPFVAHFAHLGGMLGGLALIFLLPKVFVVR